ncbi:MAG: thiol:disulfide interchange protein [Crocinitomicaceae bacterium]|nr:thiol:disulfide interchange protein [Crocinitomicaceae bacterium]|tara:strand:- start:8574 stop:9260 length:687 start_codon:yes stop_codon:yes gene_type:complete
MNLEEFLNQFSTTFQEDSILSLGIALLVGIISSGVCPCTLPVGFGFAGYVGSNEVRESKSGSSITFSFFFGIILCLTILGAIAGYIGTFLTETFGKYWALVMGIVSLIAAGIAFYGPYLRVRQLEALRRPGMGGSFVYGFIFSLGTSAAPLLLLLSVAAAEASILYGLVLAFMFGIGRGLPFLVVGLFASTVSNLAKLTWLRKSIQIISGLALLYLSFYFFRLFSYYF